MSPFSPLSHWEHVYQLFCVGLRNGFRFDEESQSRIRVKVDSVLWASRPQSHLVANCSKSLQPMDNHHIEHQFSAPQAA